MLHVSQISFFNDPRGRSPSELLTAWPTMVDVAEAASRAGVRISVVQACPRTEHLEKNGVQYHFLPFGEAAPAGMQPAAFCELLRDLAADVFHVHGLDFPRQVLDLADLAARTPIILQDHASQVPRFWRRAAIRRCLSAVAGIAFCARDQARPFIKAGLVDSRVQLYEIAESTCRFMPGDRGEARRLTAIEGNPAILWVGHLNANKDPLTVLEGVSSAALHLPDLKLYCCFASAPLLRAVQGRIKTDPILRDRVHLLGRVSHDRVELLMRAADLFVLGSRREGSGYSLMEALACGLPPVVTDIPSFRMLTGGGRAGGLWQCGNARALSEALQANWIGSSSALRTSVRSHFDQELSFHALGIKLRAMYENALGRKSDAFDKTQGQELDNPILSCQGLARMLPSVSIIMPTFNRMEFLPAAVESVLAQSFAYWELLIADDGSDDETRAYLQSLNDPRIKLLFQPHTGRPAVISNLALRAARGRYVAFLDSDDLWLPTKLEAQIESLTRNPFRKWSYTRFSLIDSSGKPDASPRHRDLGAPSGWILEKLLRSDAVIAQPSVVVCREVLEQLGAFDEELIMCYDDELWFRLAAHSEIDSVDEPLTLVRRHSKHSGSDVQAWRDRRRVFEKTIGANRDARLDPVLRKLRAEMSAGLAKSHARYGKRSHALSALFASFPHSWRYPAVWFPAAMVIASRFGPPSWLSFVRRRRARHTPAT